MCLCQLNDQPKEYETPFDNLNFWKQFRGQAGSLWLPRKGNVLLLRCWYFFPSALQHVHTNSVDLWKILLIHRRALDKYFNMLLFTSVPFFIWLNFLWAVTLSPCGTWGAPSHPFDESWKWSISPTADLIVLFHFGMHFLLFLTLAFPILHSVG